MFNIVHYRHYPVLRIRAVFVWIWIRLDPASNPDPYLTKIFCNFFWKIVLLKYCYKVLLHEVKK
jgi:hypothetical protein